MQVASGAGEGETDEQSKRRMNSRLFQRLATIAAVAALIAGVAVFANWYRSGGFDAWMASRAADRDLEVRAGGGLAQPAELRELARRAMARKDWKAATGALEQVLRSGQAGPQDVAALSRCLDAQGEIDAAYSHLRTAQEKWPNNFDIALARADFYFSRDAQSEELKALTEAAKLRPNDLGLQLRLARVAFKLEQFDQSFAAYEAIRAKGKPDDEVYRRLGAIYLHKGKPREAMLSAEIAINMNPREARNFMLFATSAAQLPERKNHESRIMVSLETAMRLEPHLSQAYVQYGRALEEVGVPESAVKFYRKGVELAPYEEQPMLTLIGMLERMGKREEAQKVRAKQTALKKAKTEVFRVAEQLRRRQGDAALQRKLGWLYVQTGRWRDARKYFAYLQSKNPNDADARKGVELCNRELEEEAKHKPAEADADHSGHAH